MASDGGAGAMTHCLAFSGAGEQFLDSRGQLLFVFDDGDGIRVPKQFNGLSEIVRKWPNQNRRSIPGRLDHVLTSATGQASSNKGNVGEAPAGGQFPECVKQEDRAWRRDGGISV